MSHLNTINVIIFIIFLSIISVSRSFIAPKSALIETRVISSLTSISLSTSTSSSSSSSSTLLSRQHISSHRKNQQWMSLCMNGRDEDEEHAQSQLKIMQVELDRCLSSMNPLDWLKAMWLERRVYLAMGKRRVKAVERREIAVERRVKAVERRERAVERRVKAVERREIAAKLRANEAGERKLINISLVDSDNVVDDAVITVNLSRDLFDHWVRDDKLLHRFDETSNTYKFEDVEEGGNYYLSKRA